MTVSRQALRTVLAVGVLAAGLVALIGLAIPAGAGAHAERATFFPDPNLGDFPEYRTDGPEHSWSAGRTPGTASRQLPSDQRRENEELLSAARYSSIQAAVNRAANGYRILVMPGVYHEDRPPARPDARTSTRTPGALTYEQHRQCPNAQNLIAILGDTERRPDLRLEVQHPDRGHGRHPERRQDRGREEQAERDPCRPRRRHLPEELHGLVLGLQQHLRARDERLPRRHDRLAATAASTGFSRSRRDHGIYENCEASLQRRLGRLPGVRPERAPRAAGRARSRVRDHHPQLQLAPQHDRDVGHGRQRHLGARQPLPPQRNRASRPTRSPAATRACRRTTRSGRTT